MTDNGNTIHKVCVYCASSERSDEVYLHAARRLGEILAENSITIVYGGGAVGSMGHLAEIIRALRSSRSLRTCGSGSTSC